MDAGDIIIIEDTPPSSPVQTVKQKAVASNPIKSSKAPSKPDMYYQTQNHEFPVAEQAMIWSRNTTNFIKQSMNSVQQNNRIPFFNNSLQNKPMGTQNSGLLPRNGYQLEARGFPSPPYNIYNFDPFVNSYYQLNGYGPSNLTNMYNNHNFWMKVKLEELPEKGEIVSQYYIDQAETPIKLGSNQNDVTPEFIDINTLAGKMQIQDSITTNENILNLSTEIDDKKRKNPVPLFLKRNRPANNKMKITEDRDPLNLAVSKVPSSTNISKEDEDDIIFIGEFKREETHLQSSEKEIKNESSTTDNNSSQDSFKEEISYKFGKRKRKNRSTLIPLRRNPKRQVQIEKDFLKMIDDVITESEKEEKQKKSSNGKNKSVKPAIKQCRRSPRNLSNSGAVYNPPSPLTTAHIREWPAEGMHERPEYDPVSRKILPFDSSIRNIAIQYQKSKSDTNIDKDLNRLDEFLVENIDNNKNFPGLCHEMLHHVLAYVATVKMLNREESKTVDQSEVKIEFLQQLNLQKCNEKIENKICDILHSLVDDVTLKEEITNDAMTNALIDLLKNTIMFYCLTNNVDKTDVAKYIASVQPEDIIKLSNEQFNLLPIEN